MKTRTNFTPEELRYLKLLAEQYPTVQAASTEIINLQAILNLPKGTEHFMSDIHGEYEAFQHVLNSCSGVVKEKLDVLYGSSLLKAERDQLATLIYYPEEKLEIISKEVEDLQEWYRITLHRLIEVCRLVTSKYTRSKVRKLLPKDFAYIIEELLHESSTEPDRQTYFNAIIDAIIETGKAEDLLKAICHLIHHLVIDSLHIVGDIYDRGPGAARIMDYLCNYHDFDIQWGNHDVLWMGAAAGSVPCIINVIRNNVRYNNWEILENGYGITMRRFAMFSEANYKLQEKKPPMERAINVLLFKAEGQAMLRHPEYNMQDRLLLDKIDFNNGTICIDGKQYPMLDTHFPTIDPSDPYKLSQEELELMIGLAHSFHHSERLQKHLKCLYQHGSLFLVKNHCLLFHAAIPLTPRGKFAKVDVCGKKVSGKELMERVEQVVREAYYGEKQKEHMLTGNTSDALDYMWYLWCGPESPLYNKDKMTTFERYFIQEKELEKEKKGAFYTLANNKETCDMIMTEFGLDPDVSKIINGHIPVHTLKGESPLRAEGRRLVIDGGFSKPYQAKTGIAGYTLIYNSHRMELVEHGAFQGRAEAVRTGQDIQSTTLLLDFSEHRLHVKDTNRGKILSEQVEDLQQLLYAYQHGFIKEH